MSAGRCCLYAGLMNPGHTTWHVQHKAGLTRGERAADFLSMVAGLQGAILLIAAKRQDAIAAAMAQHDYETDVQAKAEIDRLIAVNSRQLELLKELRSLLVQRPVTGTDDGGTSRPAWDA